MSSVTLSLLKMQALRSCRVIKPVKTCVSLNERNISFVNRMKYFDVTAERKPAWRILIQMTSRVLQNICSCLFPIRVRVIKGRYEINLSSRTN